MWAPALELASEMYKQSNQQYTVLDNRAYHHFQLDPYTNLRRKLAPHFDNLIHNYIV